MLTAKPKTASSRHVTLDLQQAAEFLRMSPAVLRQKAKAGHIKGRNRGSAGSSWKTILPTTCARYIVTLGKRRRVDS